MIIIYQCTHLNLKYTGSLERIFLRAISVPNVLHKRLKTGTALALIIPQKHITEQFKHVNKLDVYFVNKIIPLK